MTLMFRIRADFKISVNPLFNQSNQRSIFSILLESLPRDQSMPVVFQAASNELIVQLIEEQIFLMVSLSLEMLE